MTRAMEIERALPRANLLARLRKMDNPAIRRDYRLTARLAIDEIIRYAEPDSVRQTLTLFAETVMERTQGGQVMVYRTARTGDLRWMRPTGVMADRMNPEHIVGTYDRHSKIERILEDLRA
jgi:hypothetical protein